MASHLILHDIATGAEEVAFRTDRLIEAPNWSPCGSYLIVNGGGRLWRHDLGAEGLTPIRCDGLSHLNNDHGISPDGMRLAVSDSPRRGTSVIYTLPVEGGTPHRVTPNAPSWWHGWSPDGETLAYTAMRDGDFNIFTIPVDGGEETQLTLGGGHKDGPDYTPDGEWIWFNSDHHGEGADLWRNPARGGTPERMTDDAFVTWFPHPSPDGRYVLYLAYPGNTQGHPRDRNVALRLIDLKDGGIRTLATFTGGQGSINVPCWAPDGRRFAYMRYDGGERP